MCFSVGASFTASGILTLVGFLSLRKAPPRYRLFAMIPLFFAIQQFAEGVVWLVLRGIADAAIVRTPLLLIMAPIGLLAQATAKIPHHIDLIKTGSIITFLIFAFVIWPTWIPFACWKFERDKLRQNIITGLLILGVIISSTLLYRLLAYGATAEIINNNIVYSVKHLRHHFAWIGLLLYTCATVGPLFITSLPYAYLLGLAILGAQLIAWYFWKIAFISTWCFFAAILSVMVLAILPEKNQPHE
jgi:hypothetical protein